MDKPYVNNALGRIENYCNAVETTLQYWLDIHTDPDMWFDEWINWDDVGMAFDDMQGTISNGYFSFDWREAAYRRLAEEEKDDWLVCPHCGAYVYYDTYNYEECECCGLIVEEWAEVTDTDALGEHLQEGMFAVTDSAIRKAAVVDGFEAYREAITPVTGEIEDEIHETLDILRNATDNQARLVAILAGTRQWHANGNIMEDYSCMVSDLEDGDICDIRDNGLESVFTMDDLREFLEG